MKSSLPANKLEYAKATYWDERFETEDHYEWFGGYQSFQYIIRKHLHPDDKILVLGSGNSLLPVDLWRDGFKNIIAVDISSVAVEKMKEKLANMGMGDVEYVEGDMTDLPFEENHFDCVVEKGTLDVLFVENDSPWNPLPEVIHNLKKTLDEVHRVLNEKGKFVSITFSQPHFRQPLLLDGRYSWSCDVSSFGAEASFEYFVYAMKKGERQEGHHDGSLAPCLDRFGDTMQNQVDEPDFLSNIQL